MLADVAFVRAHAMLPTHRCYSLECDSGYNRGFPTHVRPVACAGGCGVAIHCSEACEKRHRKIHGRGHVLIQGCAFDTRTHAERRKEGAQGSAHKNIMTVTPITNAQSSAI